MEHEFKIGNIAFLGSDRKTPLCIYEICENGIIHCSWLNEKKELQRAPFRREELEKAVAVISVKE
jgi:hypothetical protein